MSQEPTFTRSEILHALRIEPCHITGLHNPEHHLESTCNGQRAAAYQRVLELIGAFEEELPRALHGPECGWCHRIPEQEEHRARLRRTYKWAGEEIPPDLAEPAPDAECFDLSEQEVLAAIGGGWVDHASLQALLGLGRHTSKIHRPLHRLEQSGAIVSQFANGIREYRRATS